MNITLTLLFVLCAVYGCHSGVPTLEINDLEHVDGQDRQLQFKCIPNLAQGQALSKVTVFQKAQVTPPVAAKTIYSREANKPGVGIPINGEIDTIKVTEGQTDVFVVVKPKKVANTYICKVEYNQGEGGDPSLDHIVVEEWDRVKFEVDSKQTKEGKDEEMKKKHEYYTGNEIDTILTHNLISGHDFVKAELKKDDKTFLIYTKAGDVKDPKDGVAGIKKDDIVTTYTDADKKLSVNLKTSVKETGGTFKAVFTYKDATEHTFDSAAVVLQYKNSGTGTLASYASISLLLMAVLFYSRISL